MPRDQLKPDDQADDQADQAGDQAEDQAEDHPRHLLGASPEAHSLKDWTSSAGRVRVPCVCRACAWPLRGSDPDRPGTKFQATW